MASYQKQVKELKTKRKYHQLIKDQINHILLIIVSKKLKKKKFKNSSDSIGDPPHNK